VQESPVAHPDLKGQTGTWPVTIQSGDHRDLSLLPVLPLRNRCWGAGGFGGASFCLPSRRPLPKTDGFSCPPSPLPLGDGPRVRLISLLPLGEGPGVREAGATAHALDFDVALRGDG